MKKNINIIPIILFCALCIQTIKLFSQQKDNYYQSKLLIGRYNEIRKAKNLNIIIHEPYFSMIELNQ